MREVDWGPEVVKLLLPHRPPLWMVDRVVGVRLAGPPTLRAARFLSANEPFFQGHFPGLGLMPGVLTVEGLAQSAEILATLLRLAEARGEDTLFAALTNEERRATFHPGWDREASRVFRQALAPVDGRPPAVAGGVQVRFVAPIFPGCRLDYEVVLERRLGHLAHFRFEASVAGAPVTSGTFSTAALEGP